jgi:hypothetical protein
LRDRCCLSRSAAGGRSENPTLLNPVLIMRHSTILPVLFATVLVGLAGGAPVEFAFRPAPADGNPFARELWAEVQTPDGTVRQLPAFYRGQGVWAIRARAAARGEYRLGTVSESLADGYASLPADPVGPTARTVPEPDPAGGPIRIDPCAPRQFVDGAGRGFYPLGANFPWAVGDPDTYYPGAFAAARDAGMNWARVWMAHWGRLNLDWRSVEHGPSPARGRLDLEAADRWDRLVTLAEQTGMRLQIVLQHHGQYSTTVNSNWDINPWNVGNGGFLAAPADFFTSDQARSLTRQKYRYIVARWGYSPAIFAWELFNEVKWVDARTGRTATAASNAAVAAWHAEMARHIRRLDTERHLVTTSDDSLGHPLHDTMDFLQPHLYANDMLTAVRRFDLDAHQLDRPIFHGEVGDDNMPNVSGPLRDHGYTNLPLTWAGLMNDGYYPAQIWYAQRLLEHGGLGGFAAITAFVRATGLDQRPDLRAFSPAVESRDRIPYVIKPGAHWHRQPPPTVTIPFDGRVPAQLGALPGTLVTAQPAVPDPDPFPHAVTLHLHYPRDATAIVRFSGASPGGGSIRLTLDGQVVGQHAWPVISLEAKQPPPQPPQEFVLPMKSGRRTLVLENPTGPDWVAFGSLATGLDIPALAAAGRRADDRILLWVYHRTGVLALAEPTPATATLQLEDVAAGTWQVTWWDVTTGQPARTEQLNHGGGTLALPTPAVSRHTAGWLERQ